MRFTQEDTYTGQSNDPLSLNRYLYAVGNPVMFVDPSGYLSVNSSRIFLGDTSTDYMKNIIEKTYSDLEELKMMKKRLYEKDRQSNIILGVITPDPLVLAKIQVNLEEYNWGEPSRVSDDFVKERENFGGQFQEISVKGKVTKWKGGVAYVSNNQEEFLVIYSGYGPSIGTDKGLSFPNGIIIYDISKESALWGRTTESGVSISGGLGEAGYSTVIGDGVTAHTFGVGPAVELPGMETYVIPSRTFRVIDLPEVSNELIYEIRHRK